ncbi:hypothetical protein DIPPA_22058 [Diplonema papillatum]|nr:hypothetical protein DIPPA_22058 [Diplonema papillatum]|eukprot:gene15090-23052_t
MAARRYAMETAKVGQRANRGLLAAFGEGEVAVVNVSVQYGFAPKCLFRSVGVAFVECLILRRANVREGDLRVLAEHYDRCRDGVQPVLRILDIGDNPFLAVDAARDVQKLLAGCRESLFCVFIDGTSIPDTLARGIKHAAWANFRETFLFREEPQLLRNLLDFYNTDSLPWQQAIDSTRAVEDIDWFTRRDDSSLVDNCQLRGFLSGLTGEWHARLRAAKRRFERTPAGVADEVAPQRWPVDCFVQAAFREPAAGADGGTRAPAGALLAFADAWQQSCGRLSAVAAPALARALPLLPAAQLHPEAVLAFHEAALLAVPAGRFPAGGHPALGFAGLRRGGG